MIELAEQVKLTEPELLRGAMLPTGVRPSLITLQRSEVREEEVRSQKPEAILSRCGLGRSDFLQRRRTTAGYDSRV
jgi:hypothetical protein